jgi:uncharacterized delta-60 repeat protein
MAIIPIIAIFSLLAASQAHAALMPKLEWIRTYDSPAHGDDVGWGVEVDRLGNVYVIGREYRPDLSQDYNIWLGKYDNNGSLLWTRNYDSPAHQEDVGRGLTVGPSDYIYVAGQEYREDLDQHNNIWVRKYDTNGNTVWTESYDSPNHHSDIGRGIASDDFGNIYVTGSEIRTDLAQDDNIWLRKYDTDGSTLWTRTYDSPAHNQDIGFDVASDAAGNVYISGWETRDEIGQSENIWIRKYDASGSVLWTQTYDSPNHGQDTGRGIVVDSDGNVYVTGREQRDDLGQQDNTWLRKYDTNGNVMWTRTYDSPSNQWDEGHGLSVDSAGNVYVAGFEYRGDLGQYGNIWLRKYDSDGGVLWTETYDSPGHGEDRGYGVAVDISGNIYVTGYVDREDQNQDRNIILLKYAQVPEPGTLLLLAPALLGFAGIVLKRRK